MWPSTCVSKFGIMRSAALEPTDVEVGLRAGADLQRVVGPVQPHRVDLHQRGQPAVTANVAKKNPPVFAMNAG